MGKNYLPVALALLCACHTQTTTFPDTEELPKVDVSAPAADISTHKDGSISDTGTGPLVDTQVVDTQVVDTIPEDFCVPNPCLNGGNCVNGGNDFECSCADGFMGKTCETNIDDCDPNPCEPAGECIDGVNTYTCDCFPGFSGETICTAIVCASNEYVSENTCQPCPMGSPNEAGDDASQDDTTCDPCLVGTFDDGTYTCISCPPGTTSKQGDTKCNPCPSNTFETEGQCVPCPADLKSAEGSIACALEGTDSALSAQDYAYLFWPENHWITWGTFLNEHRVQTGYYGLAIDVAAANLVQFGLLNAPASASDALQTPNSLIDSLPNAQVTYSVESNGEQTQAAGFFASDGKTKNPSQLVDMGRFMQRIQIPKVSYAGAPSLTGSVQLAAMPRHFVLTHRAARSQGQGPLTITVSISGEAVNAYPQTEWLDGERALRVMNADGEGWAFVLPELGDGVALAERSDDGILTFSMTYQAPGNNIEKALSVLAVPSNAGGEAQLDTWLFPTQTAWVESAQMKLDGSGGQQMTQATYDHERGLHVIALKNLSAAGAPGYQDWKTPKNHNWYNRHRIKLHNTSNEPVSIPIAFEGENNAAFYVVGGSPLFRDMNGEPTGTPIQISKNWHENPYWYHLYSAMEVGPGVSEVEHTFAHSKWGKAYAAAHAQLSLIGWGHNQQWDESSLGAFGESITYDPDMTLSRAMVDDVRPFLVKTKNKWSWTGNVGGANFLVYASQAGYQSPPDHQLGRMRTHYAYTGPNLTKVTYAGITRDGKIDAKITTQLGRTDDLVRAYYHVEYVFLEDVAYNRLALFQMAADRYADNGFTRYAYGHADGVTADKEVTNHKTTGYASNADRGIPLSGQAPWVMLYDSEHNQGDLPEHLANVAFVVRDYKAVIGDTTVTTPHINIMRTYNGNPPWSQMAFELGVPFDPKNKTIPAGSILKATIEYLVPPADKGAYYGTSDYLTDLPAESYQTTDMALLLASGNQLNVNTTIGTLVQTHPISLDAEAGPVAAQFTVEGGLGYTPVTIHGLPRPDGWRLEHKDENGWSSLGQAVHGNDYWQAYDDAATSSFDLVFNIHNVGSQEYRLVRAAL